MQSPHTTTYEPNNSLKKGYLHVFWDIAVEIVANRWLTWQLFKRNFLSSYKQSALGILWLVITPFASLVTFILLNTAGIFHLGTISVPYPIFAILGMSLFQLFSGGLTSCATSLSSASSMITRINFSKKSIVFASLGQALVSLLIQFVVLLVLFLIYGFRPSAYILLLPVLVVPLVLFTLGLGLVVAIFNSFINDIGRAISGLLAFFMFLTPILYQRTAGNSLMDRITSVNPFYYLVAVPRDLMLLGKLEEWQGYFFNAGLSVIIFIVGILIFHQTESRITERL